MTENEDSLVAGLEVLGEEAAGVLLGRPMGPVPGAMLQVVDGAREREGGRAVGAGPRDAAGVIEVEVRERPPQAAKDGKRNQPRTARTAIASPMPLAPAVTRTRRPLISRFK